jgi:hypothetical protein
MVRSVPADTIHASVDRDLGGWAVTRRHRVSWVALTVASTVAAVAVPAGVIFSRREPAVTVAPIEVETATVVSRDGDNGVGLGYRPDIKRWVFGS